MAVVWHRQPGRGTPWPRLSLARGKWSAGAPPPRLERTTVRSSVRQKPDECRRASAWGLVDGGTAASGTAGEWWISLRPRGVELRVFFLHMQMRGISMG